VGVGKGRFHRPSELNPDFETLLSFGDVERVLTSTVKWVMKNTHPAAARAWLAASDRFSSPF
jgi:hypothetical protein